MNRSLLNKLQDADNRGNLVSTRRERENALRRNKCTNSSAVKSAIYIQCEDAVARQTTAASRLSCPLSSIEYKINERYSLKDICYGRSATVQSACRFLYVSAKEKSMPWYKSAGFRLRAWERPPAFLYRAYSPWFAMSKSSRMGYLYPADGKPN